MPAARQSRSFRFRQKSHGHFEQIVSRAQRRHFFEKRVEAFVRNESLMLRGNPKQIDNLIEALLVHRDAAR